MSNIEDLLYLEEQMNKDRKNKKYKWVQYIGLPIEEVLERFQEDYAGIKYKELHSPYLKIFINDPNGYTNEKFYSAATLRVNTSKDRIVRVAIWDDCKVWDYIKKFEEES